MNMKVIARIHTDFPTKFGIPRQSGLAPDAEATIVFEPDYKCADAVRGLEGFSHIWLIWGFSAVDKAEWSPTVRPPRLGGNKRVGVFATRSPYRPNPIGLSSVKINEIRYAHDGTQICVSGADLMDGTPIYDIKPYIPYTDCHSDAIGGFSVSESDIVDVCVQEELLKIIPENKRSALVEILHGDPRPAYQNNPERIYGFNFAGYEIKFSVNDGLLTVCDILKSKD